MTMNRTLQINEPDTQSEPASVAIYAFLAWVAGLVVVLGIDPFVTGNAWWSRKAASEGDADIAWVLGHLIFLATPIVVWTCIAAVIAWILHKHSHRLAAWSVACTVFTGAALPGAVHAIALEDSANPSPGTTLMLYLFPLTMLAGFGLWVAYLIKRPRKQAP